MPKDKPNEEEIRKIMAKAKKAASGGKTPPQKKVKEKPDSGGTEEKPLIQEKPKEEKKPGPAKPSSEIGELKALIIQRNQDITRQNERIGAIENFLKEAQRQAKAQMAQETSQSDNDENLTDEERLAQAQAEQDKKGQGVPGQSQIPTNVPLGLAYLHEFNPTFKQIAETVRVAITKGKAEKEGSENIYEAAGKKIMETMFTKFITQQTGGGDSWLDQFKTFLAMQNAVAAGLFNSLKLAGKGQAETVMSSLFGQPQSPETPPIASPPPEDHII